MHRIEVRLKTHLPDPVGRGLIKDVQDFGINSITDARVVDVYLGAARPGDAHA